MECDKDPSRVGLGSLSFIGRQFLPADYPPNLFQIVVVRNSGALTSSIVSGHEPVSCTIPS